MIEATDSLLDRLMGLMVGGCSCMTKTPDVRWHKQDCTFRVASEAYDEIVKLSAMTARLAPEPSVWQPMESAPKDGTYIILATTEGSWVGHYSERSPGGFVFDNPWHSMMLNHHHMPKWTSSVPTHWMPLPQPPTKNPEHG